MRHPAGETVTVDRPGVGTGTYDEQGNEIIGPDTTFDILNVAVAPATTEEDPQNLGLVVTTGLTLYPPYGTVFHTTDRLTIMGIDGWQVVGDTGIPGWRNPINGRTPGAEVSVRRAV